MPADDPLPTFCIVIPTRGRPGPLGRCLQAIARLDYPTDRFEVVVVDDGSPEPLAPRIRAGLTGAQDHDPPAPDAPVVAAFPLRVVRREHAGPAAARNTGVQAAAAEYIAFTDDDCAPRPGWLRAFAGAFARDPDHLLGGRTRNGLPGNVYASTSQLLIDYLYGYYDGRPGRPRLFTSNNMAVSKTCFEELGGFDTRFGRAAGEDREFCDRWGERGSTYVPDAVVEHAHAMDLGDFLCQHFNYGRGAYDFRAARRERGGDAVGLEPASFYSGLLRYPLIHLSGPRRWLIAALMAATQIASAAGLAVEGLVRS